MKLVIKKMSGLIISGILLLIPIYAVIYVLQAMHKQMKQFADIAAPYIPVDNVVGFALASIIGWVFVIGGLAVLGLLAQTRLFSWFSREVEENVLSFLPGYTANAEKLRAKLEQKIEAEKES